MRTSTTKPQTPTLAATAAKRLREHAASGVGRFAQYHDDPVGFARDVLALNVWARQAEILLAVLHHENVAVRSGHKIGKTAALVAVALWFACTRTDARVILTANTHDQIRDTLWKELRKVHGTRKHLVGGVCALDPGTGVQWPDGRQIIGKAVTKPEAMAGLSGNILIAADEASGIEENIWEVIEGNRAGGAKLVMTSNPTRLSGKFYRAFTTESEFWHRIAISSEEAAEAEIPWLATREYCEGRRREWGAASAQYTIRIRGDFAEEGSNNVISVALVTSALQRWEYTEDSGPLDLGVDVARFGDDESCICPRRGHRVHPLLVFKGLDTVELAGMVLKVSRDQKLRSGTTGKPRVKVDSNGVGAGTADVLRRAHVAGEIELYEVNSSTRSDDETTYTNLRSQLYYAAKDWLQQGGALPQDVKLEAELVAARFGYDAQGRMKVESKDEIRKRLQRSPDRADALFLAVYTPRRAPVARGSGGAGGGRYPIVNFDDRPIG